MGTSWRKAAGEKLCGKCAGKHTGGWNGWSEAHAEDGAERERDEFGSESAAQERQLRCSTCPKEADVMKEADVIGPRFADRKHFTDSQVEH